MKQLITRIDDSLHAKVKAKAEAEGRSVNDLVSGLLEAAVEDSETDEAWHRRLIADGTLVEFTPAGPVPSHEELEARLVGLGTAVGEALDQTRGRW
ncbi:toxin-antitoxin system HicB family antitoxin [Prauserella alba]|uniref:Toxin-antitoxin system HicB family antitoxin n=1 Tax=Prauserella alba TaxID=176898 RepID=A0ABN1VMW7_9PSEU|nr:toxin-antitoxin system HicB family antitoxin [Prauserella alba]MCP2181038.1 HicB family protein [Prauserella alba]